MAIVLSPMEAEHAVQALTQIPVEDIGTLRWKAQREAVEQLNAASHKCAVDKSDDYVLRALITHDKLPLLLHDLLVMEQWRRRVLPDVVPALLQSSTASYFYVYYESVIVNLFECLLYHAEASEALGDDLLELIDYCWRCIAADLLSAGDRINDVREIHPKVLADLPDEERFAHQLNELAVSRALSCVSILWFIIDKMGSLALAVHNSVLMKNDLVVGIADVILRQPWMRRGTVRGGSDEVIYQKFREAKWTTCSRQDAMLLSPVEAHAWFAMHYLLCDRLCRSKYGYTQHKKDQIIRIKRFLNETLVDQIPALVDVQRALEELSFMEPPVGTEEKFRGSLIIEHVPRIMAAVDLGGRRKWQPIVETCRERLMDRAAAMDDAQRLARMFAGLYDEPPEEA